MKLKPTHAPDPLTSPGQGHRQVCEKSQSNWPVISRELPCREIPPLGSSATCLVSLDSGWDSPPVRGEAGPRRRKGLVRPLVCPAPKFLPSERSRRSELAIKSPSHSQEGLGGNEVRVHSLPTGFIFRLSTYELTAGGHCNSCHSVAFYGVSSFRGEKN